jgi:hypothetical protein
MTLKPAGKKSGTPRTRKAPRRWRSPGCESHAPLRSPSTEDGPMPAHSQGVVLRRYSRAHVTQPTFQGHIHDGARRGSVAPRPVRPSEVDVQQARARASRAVGPADPARARHEGGPGCNGPSKHAGSVPAGLRRRGSGNRDTPDGDCRVAVRPRSSPAATGPAPGGRRHPSR